MAMTIELPSRPAHLRVADAVRRYPIFPVAVLLIVLIIPGIFADLIARHDPRVGTVTDRLAPPIWEGSQTEVRAVVEKLDPQNAGIQVVQSSVQRKLKFNPKLSGDARILTGVKTVVESPERENLDTEMRLEHAQSLVKLGGATILGGGEVVSIGDQVDVLPEKLAVKTVIEKRPDKDKIDTQIRLKDAQKAVDQGNARIVGGGEVVALDDQVELLQVDLGAPVEVLTRPDGRWKYPLGTDKIGRDQLSRILHGARISLTIAAIAIALGAAVGVFLGLVSGYFGGNIDSFIMRIVDIKLALPSILLALVLGAVMGPGFDTVILVIVLTLWARYARMVRGETLRVRQLDFIARARVAGASNLRILVRHIFPNVVNSVIVLATLEVGHVILFEASLSFLGVGIPRPHPAWGLMVADGRVLVVSAWWVSFFPGLAILLTVLSMNLFGDWLRDRLDPKLKQTQ